MKTNPVWRAEAAQHWFEAVLVLLVLIVIPSLPLGRTGGGWVMLIASVVGLGLYLVLFGRALHLRGQLGIVALAGSLGALFAWVLSRTAGGM
jgi:hypothetical protein